MHESEDGIDEFEEDFDCGSWDDEDLLDIPPASTDQKNNEDPFDKFDQVVNPQQQVDQKNKPRTSKRGILVFLSLFFVITIGTGTYGYFASNSKIQEAPVIKLGATPKSNNNRQTEPENNSINRHIEQQNSNLESPPISTLDLEEKAVQKANSNKVSGLTPLPSNFDNKVELEPLATLLPQPKTGQTAKLQQEKLADASTEDPKLSLLENELLSKTEETPRQNIDIYDSPFEEIPTDPVLGALHNDNSDELSTDLNPFSNEIKLDNIQEEYEILSERSNSRENHDLEDPISQKEVDNLAVEENIDPEPIVPPKAEVAIARNDTAEPNKLVQSTSPNTAKVMAKKPKAPVIITEIPQWEIRGIQPNSAIIHDKKTGETRTVEPGNTIKGIGRVKAIKKQNGLWTVIGTKANVN